MAEIPSTRGGAAFLHAPVEHTKRHMLPISARAEDFHRNYKLLEFLRHGPGTYFHGRCIRWCGCGRRSARRPIRSASIDPRRGRRRSRHPGPHRRHGSYNLEPFRSHGYRSQRGQGVHGRRTRPRPEGCHGQSREGPNAYDDYEALQRAPHQQDRQRGRSQGERREERREPPYPSSLIGIHGRAHRLRKRSTS